MMVSHEVISMLPSRVAKALELVGIHGTKEEGLSHFQKGYERDNLRSMMCRLFFLSYHLYLRIIVFDKFGDIESAEAIVKQELKKTPNSAWYLVFAGRVQFMKGNFETASKLYLQSLDVNTEMAQLHQLCFSELSLCFGNLLQWKEAAKYLKKLLQSSNWSMASYAYYWCALQLMVKDQLTEEEQQEVDSIMSQIPLWTRRIAGYNLPLEVVFIRKSKRYFAQDKYLPLPAIEFLYILYGFTVIAKRRETLTEMYELTDKCLTNLGNQQNKGEHHADNLCLGHLFKGSCLRHLDSPLQAEECFRYIWREGKNIKEDNYVVPFSYYEMALLLMSQGRLEDAGQYLDLARKYKSYNLEMQLLFKIEATAEELEKLKQAEPK